MGMANPRATGRRKAATAEPSAAKAALGDGPIDGGTEHSEHLIVGIGASAGGLDAFRAFFSLMPVDSGMAFVLVQHLDPDYKSALAEIIGECTAMPVVQASDGTVAAPNTIAVIPENAILKIEGGVLRVALPESPTARRSSIDTFLVSLAEDQGENAVGIILSGFGSDGTAGIEAIKEGGGLTLSEAAFDHRAKFGMPQSATAGGFVDYVLRPEEMPARLLEHRNFRSRGGTHDLDEPMGPSGRANHLTTICAVLNSRLGRDFGQYKSSTLMRRVRRRMQVLHIDDPLEYIVQLRSLPNEPELLFREILIGVTRFFRDPTMFETLATTVLPEIIANGSVKEPIRVWVAGCATGEEAYSLAILFSEALAREESPRKVTIFATDVDDRAVTVARAGLYSDTIEADTTVIRLEQNFLREGQRYRVAKHIREMCVFSTQDLVKDPPFSKIDMVTCRNLLIYFEPSLQQRVIATFHYGLKANGFLWLGPSETIAASGRLFKVVDKRTKVFRRLDVAPQIPRVQQSGRMNPASPPQQSAEAETIDEQATRMIAQYAPAYLVFDSQHEIQRFSGPVEKFMQPVSGGASLNLFRMLHTQLRSPVRSLVRKALEHQRPAKEAVTFQVAGRGQTINLIAEPMAEPIDGRRCVLLAFQELSTLAAQVAKPDDATPSSDLQHSELVAAREKLQTITEELETANEELQSSNEEFQSVNEELHSTVEELETSKEELSSINEELQTVNTELNNRADSLVRSNSDLANLFDSTSIATLFLDNGSHIRRFTPAITEIFNVREGDEGRLISDFSSRLAGSTLTQDIVTVLRDLGSIEREAESEDGSATYLVRVKPYRDLNNVIDGVVITLIDISDRKKLERDRAHLAAIVASSEDAIVSHDLDGVITSWNDGAEKIYGYAAREMIGQPMSTLLDDVQIDEWPANLARLRRGEAITNIDISRVTKGDRIIHVSLNVSPIRDSRGVIIGASAVARDIAARKRGEYVLRESESRLQLACEVADLGAWDADLTSGTSVWTPRMFDLLGLDHDCAASPALFFDHVHPDDVTRVVEQFNASVAGRTQYNQEFRIRRPDGEIRHLVGVGRVTEETKGEPTRMVGVNFDITERKEQEAKIALLMGEVNHRSMNLLTVVRAIAARTVHSGPAEFMKSFDERLQGLAASQNVLVTNSWRAVPIGDLVRSQLSQFGSELDSRVMIDGPSIEVTASAAQALGMALHELATNASKYGALSNATGQVSVIWGQHSDAGGVSRFTMSWVERDGPPVMKPSRHGFGSTLISLMTNRSLGCEAEIDFAPTGLVWRIDCPAQKVIENWPAAR
ncbi:CheR family methyltransferase [Brevundimonas sp. TWP2-3-4b2]|uniref:CheR family methyltransferase n=1 Tax=Brevundimonas sp. TWP2-3-4b2 TaxID=2804595 RepID=UPI003CF04041